MDLRRRRDIEIARYEAETVCSAKELRTIIALWRDGSSLRAHARAEGVAPAAIEHRIMGLHTRAILFYRWWRLKNIARARY